MSPDNYYLDLKILLTMSEREQDYIHGYYRDMLFAYHDGRKEMALSYMLTLINGGFLLNNRDRRLNQLLEEDEQL